MEEDEAANTPGLAEPVSHDSHHAGPDGRLQQAVQDPQAAVQVDVVDVQPLRHGAEDKLLQARQRGGFRGAPTGLWKEARASNSPPQQSRTGRSRGRSEG